MKLIILLSLILYQVVEQPACKPNPTDKEAAEIWDYYMKEHQVGKFKYTTASEIQYIPLGKKAAYGRWLMKFVVLKSDEKKQGLDFPDDLNLPRGWKVKGGESGQSPPPWSYVPNGGYRPLFCYDYFQKGECEPRYVTLEETRWGYNHWNDTCEPFHYSGCGGNHNKFIRKEECEEVCRSPVTCCDKKMADYPSEYPAYEVKP